MSSRSSRQVKVGIRCEKCSNVTHQTVHQLIGVNALRCDCGNQIDLQSGYYAVLIQKLGQACADADAVPLA
jgi:hypothetical protein